MEEGAKESQHHETSTLEDQWLWNAFKEGDRQAFSTLYTAYVNKLYAYGLKITPNRELVRDAIQDLFIELWKSRQTLSHTSSVKYYLYSCTRRKITRYLSRSSHILNDDKETTNPFLQVSSPEEAIIDTQTTTRQHSLLQKAMDRLTQRQREALFLKYYEGLANAEIASLMAINEQSVYNLISQGLSAIKKYFPAEILIFFLSYLCL